MKLKQDIHSKKMLMSVNINKKGQVSRLLKNNKSIRKDVKNPVENKQTKWGGGKYSIVMKICLNPQVAKTIKTTMYYFS